MRILITGIAGRIGVNLVNSLVVGGHSVRGLVWERDRRTEKLADMDVELLEGSLTDADDVRSVVDGMDIVCHLGATFQGGGPFSNEEQFEMTRQTPTFYEFDMSKGAKLIGYEPTVDVFELVDLALTMRAGDQTGVLLA